MTPLNALQDELKQKRVPTCGYPCYHSCLWDTGKPSSCSYCSTDYGCIRKYILSVFYFFFMEQTKCFARDDWLASVPY